MERKSWKLLVLVVLAVVMVCVTAGFAGAEGHPANPYAKDVRKIDQIIKKIGKRGTGGYYTSSSFVSFEEIQTPTLGPNGHGKWAVHVNPQLLTEHGQITERYFAIASKDSSGDYATEYLIKNTTNDTIESCDFVTPGNYRLIAYYDFADQDPTDWEHDVGYGYYLDFTVSNDAEHPAENYPTVAEKVTQVVQECQVAGDDWQTALNLHDWLTHHAYYDHSLSFYGAGDVLIRGYGVCDSYSKAYLMLCQEAGIPVSRVIGYAGESHAWNAIQLDGLWYLVDVTWDDPGDSTLAESGNECYDYFCLNDDLMNLDHSNDGTEFAAGQCNSLAANYYVRAGETAWDQLGNKYYDNGICRYSSDILNRLNANESSFQINCQSRFYTEIELIGNQYSSRYVGAGSAMAKRSWALLAASMSQSPFTLTNGNQVYVTVAYDRDDNYFDCQIRNEEPDADISWEVVQQENRWNLLLSGDGNMPNYASSAAVPWNAAIKGKTIDRVVVSSGITRIGSYAFAGLNDNVRIDFLQNTMPAVSANAFGEITAVCRYYNTDSSWNAATDTNKVNWIDLPEIANSDIPLELRFQENAAHETEWAVGPRTDSYNHQTVIRADQAKEITYRDRWVVFQAIPTAAEDRDVYEGLDAPTVLLFMEGTSGTYSINFTGKPAQLRWVESRSWGGLNLTVTGPAGNTLEDLVVCDGNQITYNGNVSLVTLTTTQEDVYPTVTVNGNVGEVTYYDATSDRPFTGTLTVSGTIAHGTVHSQSSLYVPGISATDEPVQFGDIATYTFENVQQTTPVITLIDVAGENGTTHKESRLSIGSETIQPTQLSLDKFTINYFIYSDRIAFDLYPKEDTGLGKYSAYIENILAEEYNPGFTTADIIQGPDTVVYVQDTGTGASDPTIEFGENKAAAVQAGVDRMYLQNCKVKANWPVSQIMVWQQSDRQGPVVLEVNGQVGSIGMFLNQTGGRIYTGENGAINSGYWDRGIRGNRNFSAVGSGVTVAENGNLCVMSRKEGQSIMAVLADDASVTTAAGNQAGSGTFASMDVRDATQAELSSVQTALSSYLTDNGLTENNVVSVFDVSVSTYQRGEGDILTKVEDLHELNSTVDVSIANSAGDDAQVVRLHNGTVEEMENKAGSASGTVYRFESDRFSTYALVVKAAQELLVLELPAGTKTIEAEAFKGVAATTVIIPEGCETIGERAFAESSVQIVVMPTGISIGTNAFPTGTTFYTPEEWAAQE